MARDELSKLRAKRDHYEEWLRRFRKARKYVAEAQANLELTKWELDALEQRPAEARAVPLEPVLRTLDSEYTFVTKSLPLMPDYGGVSNAAMGTVTISGTSSVFDWVSRVGQLGTPNAYDYAVEYTGRYRALQKKSDRVVAVRQRLQVLENPKTIGRFDEACSAYSAARARAGPRLGAAIAIRTLVDGVQGDLFALARRAERENMTWDFMAERLAQGGRGSGEYGELLGQNSIRSSLIQDLSSIAKGREGRLPLSLDNLWTQTIDHLYVVCGLIRTHGETTSSGRKAQTLADQSAAVDAAKRPA